MKTPARAISRAVVLAVAALSLASALAQSPTAATAEPSKSAATARPDRKIERIRTEDAGTRIDELRVGGETQQITVQPKNGSAAYEVRPAEGARGTAPATTNNDTNGSRVWNVLKF